MKSQNNTLVLRQLDRKFQQLQPLKDIMPSGGWVSLIRKTLNMSLRQLGSRMSISLQSVRNVEHREAEGTITLKALKEAAEALDMTLVYGFIPKDGSLEKRVERKAHDMAGKIVNRTSTTMKLEDQENSKERINLAIEELAGELKKEIPKSLWD